MCSSGYSKRAPHKTVAQSLSQTSQCGTLGPPHEAGTGVGGVKPGRRGLADPIYRRAEFGAGQRGGRRATAAHFFTDGPRPALSTEKNVISEIYHGRVRERALGVFKLWVPRTFASARPSTRIIRHKTGSPSLVSQPHDLRSSVGPRHGVRARACRSCGALDAILAIYQRSKTVRRRPS